LVSAKKTARFLRLSGLKAVTGDPIPAASGQGVYDFRSGSLIRFLAEGGDEQAPFLLAGHSLDEPDRKQSVARLKEKLAAGASAIVLTPTLDADGLSEALDREEFQGVPVLITLTYTPSVPMLDVLREQLPSFRAPPTLRAAIAGSKSAEEATQLALAAAVLVAERVKDRIVGVLVAAPYGRWQGALPLLRALEPVLYKISN
jgi:5,10-methylenetetrahydrofolate reductase